MHRESLTLLMYGAVMMTCVSAPAQAAPLGTAFTYQGRLRNGANVANGTHDLRFRLFDASSLGNQVGSTLCFDNFNVVDGLFTVSLDFGSVPFDGQALWLQIDVRIDNVTNCNTGTYTLLSPRQALSATPYALALRLPLVEASDAAGGGDVISITATSNNADCAQFNLTDPTNPGEAVEGRTAGTGDAIQGINTGTGRAGYFEISNAASGSPAIYATTNGTGPGLHVRNNASVLKEMQISASSINTDGAGFFGDPLFLNDLSSNSVLIGVGGGNCGIGGATSTFPLAPLHVDGGTDAALATLASGYFLVGDAGGANVVMDNNEIMARNDSAVSPLHLQAEGGNLLIQAFSSAYGVAIATTNIPAGVRLAVNGKVLCEELEVQLSQDWPDYVFEDDYELMPLDEVSEFIQREKHLPGIPSAQEIKRNGLTVGQMQVDVVRKVEELTLHLIELDRQVQALKQENASLRTRLGVVEPVDVPTEVLP